METIRLAPVRESMIVGALGGLAWMGLLSLPASSASPVQGQPSTALVSQFPADWIGPDGDAGIAFQNLSGNGRYAVVYTTSSPNSPQYPCCKYRAWRRDLQTKSWELVSKNNLGEPTNSFISTPTAINFDGRYVVYGSDTIGTSLPPTIWSQLFLRDMIAETTTCITLDSLGQPGNHDTFKNRITQDGRFIVYESYASNLVPGDTNGVSDLFVYDRLTQQTERVNTTSSGGQADGLGSGDAGISIDGRFISFVSTATNLVPGAFNGTALVYVKDRLTGAVEHVSKNSNGESANAYSEITDISSDGRFVVWASDATNLVPGASQGGVFVYDRTLGKIGCASSSVYGEPGNKTSERPALSPDGHFVSFISSASNLLPGGSPPWWNVYRKDLWTGEIILISVNDHGQAGAGNSSGNSGISSDGRYVLFDSQAYNLSPEDPFGDDDVFIRDTGWPSSPQKYCIAGPNSLACLPSMTFSGSPSVSPFSGFLLTTSNLRNQQYGLTFYGTTSSLFVAIPPGWLCVKAPLVRTQVQQSGGSQFPAADCTGRLQLDFNAWVQSGIDPALVLGQAVWAQSWIRDPDLPATSHLSDGVQFTLGP